MKRILCSLALTAISCGQSALAQVASQPFAGTLDTGTAQTEALRGAAELAKQTALTQMRQLGGRTAVRAAKLASLEPHQFLERIAVSPVAGPSTIAPPKPSQSTPVPSVNWTFGEGATAAHPGVALLLARKDGESEFAAKCTGTLIRQNVVLTAAHCVCWSKNPDENYPTGKACAQGAGTKAPSPLTTPSNWRVFFQHAGVREVKQVITDEGYRFDEGSVRNDLALLVLSDPVRDIDPPTLPLSTNPASPWQTGEIIGFGFSATGGQGASILAQLTQPGLKARGQVKSSRCDGQKYLDPAGSLCSLFAPKDDGSTATVCSGDSGGPLRLFDAAGTAIGVTSGRSDENCAATGTVAFQMATSYQAHRAWIDSNLEAVAVESVPGRWPTFGENLRDVIQRRNSVPFDDSGAYLSEGWMQEPSVKKVLATINSSGSITAFEVQNRQGSTLCRGEAGAGNHMRNVDYCFATVPPGTQFRIVAKGKPSEFLQYVVTKQTQN